MFFCTRQAGFVTSSTDGKVNFWSLSNLREPAESLQVPSDSASCFAVAPESETLVMGDENGALYAAAFSSSGGAGGAGGSSGQTSRRRQVRKLQANVDAALQSAQQAQPGAGVTATGATQPAEFLQLEERVRNQPPLGPTYVLPPLSPYVARGRQHLYTPPLTLYSTNDACMNTFTQEQVQRMETLLEFAPRRASLVNSIGFQGLLDRENKR